MVDVKKREGLTRFLESSQIALDRAVQDMLAYGCCTTLMRVDASGNLQLKHIEITKGSTDG